MTAEKQAIRALNDDLRKNLVGGSALITTGVAALGPDFVLRIVRTLAVFDDFNQANDPHGEHDFGAFEVEGHAIFFKIDLYEEPDVKDANGEPVVTRVLTLMLAEDY
jgi:hypothetical protein